MDEIPAKIPKIALSNGNPEMDEVMTPGTATLAEAEQVHQEFNNSTVNVVAGNLIVQNFGGGIPKIQEIPYEELIMTVNENTMQSTADNILTDFKHQELHEEGCVVHPQMVQIDVNSFYRGHDGLASTPNASTSVACHNEVQKNQLIKESWFHRQQGSRNKTIDVKDFMESIWERQELKEGGVIGFTAIVASAGSGKTTLTRRMARKALDIMSSHHHNENMSHDHPNPTMVHYIELKEIQEDKSMKLSQFLFGGLASMSEQNQVFKWLVQHQSEAIIIFDGLDQTKCDFDPQNRRKIGNDEIASPSMILFNILARNILPQVKIFIASREFRISELPLKARPDRIIALNGLILEDAKTLFISLLGEDGKVLWEKIEAMSPRLLQLVCVPVFLILTAIVMGRDPSTDPPSTITELYNRIVFNLESLETIRNEKISAIIKNLKNMAFHGMQEGRVLFKDTDLARFSVTAQEVVDLMSKIPGKRLVSCRLMQKDFNFFFCHQSMQEFLAASFVAEMKFDDFSNFIKEHIHGERWSVVRRFVTGIVSLKPKNELHDVSDWTKKQEILFQSILSQLEKNDGSYVPFMELYTVIYESNNDSLINKISEIDLSLLKLSRDEIHVVGSLIARIRHLRSLNLAYCQFDPVDVQIIGRNLKNRIHVLKLTTTEGDDVELRNIGGAINISGEGIFGHFDFKERLLVFEWFHNLDRFYIADFLNQLFLPESIKINVPCADLRRISVMCKVETLLINCYQNRNIDWRSLEHFVNEYQVKRLDIIADGNAATKEYNDVLKHGNGMDLDALDVSVKVHCSFYVRNPDNLQSILDVCRERKIESIRCMIDWIYRPSFDDIISLLKLSKNLTLIYCRQSDILRGDDFDKVYQILKDLDSELEVLCDVNHDTSWQLIIQLQPGSATLDRNKRTGQRSDMTPNRKRKQESISRGILMRVEKADKKCDRMEYYANIIKKIGGDAMKTLTVIDVSKIKMSRDEQHTIGSLIAKRGGLNYLGLWSCSINSDNVAILTNCLKQRVLIDDIELRENNLSAEALGSFLGLRPNETNYLEWKVVRSTRAISKSTPAVMSRHIKLTKDGDVIKIHDEGKEFKGRFHVKESKLVLDEVNWFGHLIYCSRLFAPGFIEITDGLLYVTLHDLRKISEITILNNQLSKVMLDCTEEKTIDWLLIEDFVKKHQVKLLDIAAKGETSIEELDNILKKKNQYSTVRVDIHWMFRVANADDVLRMLDACQQNKMESVRCVVEYDLRLDDILKLVENSKKLTLIYFDERHLLKGGESGKFQTISRDLGLRLEVLCGHNRDKDAWWMLDFKEFWEDTWSRSEESSGGKFSEDETTGEQYRQDECSSHGNYSEDSSRDELSSGEDSGAHILDDEFFRDESSGEDFREEEHYGDEILDYEVPGDEDSGQEDSDDEFREEEHYGDEILDYEVPGDEDSSQEDSDEEFPRDENYGEESLNDELPSDEYSSEEW